MTVAGKALTFDATDFADDTSALVTDGSKLVLNAADVTMDAAYTVTIGAALAGTPDDDQLYGGLGLATDGRDSISAGNGNDIVDGNNGNDRIDGGNGNDTLLGGNGNDIIIDLNDGNDMLVGGDGADSIGGGNGNDTLDGGDGNDILVGYDGADSLSGGAGDDMIVGGEINIGVGTDADTLTGGAGNDNFLTCQGNSGVFTAGKVAPGTADIITDFNGGTRGSGVHGGTGDNLEFWGLGEGTLANYAEQTATSYAVAESQANGLFTSNSGLKYVVVQVASDSWAFASFTPGSGADTLIFLQGVALTGISHENFDDLFLPVPG